MVVSATNDMCLQKLYRQDVESRCDDHLPEGLTLALLRRCTITCSVLCCCCAVDGLHGTCTCAVIRSSCACRGVHRSSTSHLCCSCACHGVQCTCASGCDNRCSPTIVKELPPTMVQGRRTELFGQVTSGFLGTDTASGCSRRTTGLAPPPTTAAEVIQALIEYVPAGTLPPTAVAVIGPTGLHSAGSATSTSGEGRTRARCGAANIATQKQYTAASSICQRGDGHAHSNHPWRSRSSQRISLLGTLRWRQQVTAAPPPVVEHHFACMAQVEGDGWRAQG